MSHYPLRIRITQVSLMFLILAMLVSVASAQEYPQNTVGGSPAAGQAGNSWFLVVSITGQTQAVTDAKGPVAEVLVEQVLDYTTEYHNAQDNVYGVFSFLEKIDESGAGKISVGERLAVHWPLEQLLSNPEECSKCQEDVFYVWPAGNENQSLGFCGVCGSKWEELSEYAALSHARNEHEAQCEAKATPLQKFCCGCGEKLIPNRQTCNPPAGKWIIGGRPGGASGQNKAFSLDGYYVHYNPSVVTELVRTLRSWERDNDPNGQNNWGD